jgi:hypothetical protein
MILRQRKTPILHGSTKQVVKFAFLPKKIKEGKNDSDGPIIWLEKYIIEYRYNSDNKCWRFNSSITYNQFIMDKLEK